MEEGVTQSQEGEKALTVRAILEADPHAFAVLERFGIRLDPFTIIALNATPEELAEYSALRDPGELRRALLAGGQTAQDGRHLT